MFLASLPAQAASMAASLPGQAASLPGQAASPVFFIQTMDWAIQGLSVPAGVGQVHLGM